MLVLALQFSKGSERGRTHAGYLTTSIARDVIGRAKSCGALRGQRERELHAERRGVKTQMGRLPQNGREDKVRRADMSRGRILRLTCHYGLPTNAPTGSGSNRVGRMPTND
jgi:hypothetical protein